MSTRYDRTNLPTSGWADYRKKNTTAMVPITGPCTVTTKEGEYPLPDGWAGFLALDVDGDPYPVAMDVFNRSYEPADD